MNTLHMVKHTLKIFQHLLQDSQSVPGHLGILCLNSVMTELFISLKKQSIDLQSKSMDWFLYDNSLRHEGVKGLNY